MSHELGPFLSLLGVAAFLCSVAVLWLVLLRSRAQQWAREEAQRSVDRRPQQEAYEQRIAHEKLEIERQRQREEDEHRRSLDRRPFELLAIALPHVFEWIKARNNLPAQPCDCGRTTRPTH